MTDKWVASIVLPVSCSSCARTVVPYARFALPTHPPFTLPTYYPVSPPLLRTRY